MAASRRAKRRTTILVGAIALVLTVPMNFWLNRYPNINWLDRVLGAVLVGLAVGAAFWFGRFALTTVVGQHIKAMIIDVVTWPVRLIKPKEASGRDAENV